MNYLQTEKGGNAAVEYIRLGCLLLISLLEGVTILLGELFPVSLQYSFVMLINLAGALLLGTVLTGGFPNKTAKKLFFLGLGFCLYMGLLQIYDFSAHWLEEGYYPRYGRSAFFCEYMVLLPLAAMLEEKQKDRGFLLHAGCYLAAILGYAVLTAVIYLGGGGQIRQYVSLWIEARLSVVWNPNILGGILLVGIGLTLALFFSTKKICLKIGLGLFFLGEYLMLCLTNSRTCLIMAGCILGGTLFFLIWRGGIKSFFLGFVAAVLTLAITFAASSALFSMRVDYMFSNVMGGKAEDPGVQEALSEMSAEVEKEEEEKVTAIQSMYAVQSRENAEETPEQGHFGGRTDVWKGCLKALKEEPEVLLVGTRSVGDFLGEHNGDWKYSHAHNAWFQILVGSGLGGLIFALVFTWLAVKNSFLLFFQKESTMAQKLVGITLFAIMGSQFFEPYLFYVQYPCIFLQIPFMLGLGYVMYWVGLLPNREKPRKTK